jgi:F-type H+-transporting ATPase subunit alpha
VVSIGDEVVQVEGLERPRLDELVEIEGGGEALVVRAAGDRAGCVLLGRGDGIRAGAPVRATGRVLEVPVGEALLGRVVDALGHPLDGLGPVETPETSPVERPAPAIVDRAFVSEPLTTGLLVVDAMLPLGRGQRELILGDRKTGKTAVAVDAILSQKRSDVICVYAAIGQKTSTVARLIEAVRASGPFERTIFVVGAAESPPGQQWLVPYAACSMAEYFRDRGRHALVVYDDLTKHADVHRELSLLLRMPPGREAFPGDVFHLHARLLERAAKLSPARGGGSLTALPVAETQAGNISAYIPTNLISITDGQIHLEPRLFHAGQKPAVDVGLSVSRVGGKAQPRVLRRMAEHLRIDYAQFLELELFTRFGGVTDRRTAGTLAHGRRIRFLLRQPQSAPLSVAEEAVLLLALEARRLDPVPEHRLVEARRRLLDEVAPRAGTLAPNWLAGEDAEEERSALLAAIDAALAGFADTRA